MKVDNLLMSEFDKTIIDVMNSGERIHELLKNVERIRERLKPRLKQKKITECLK